MTDSARSILSNLTTITLSLFLALIIWSQAVRENNPPVTDSFQIPVEIVAGPKVLVINEPVQEVEVRISGPQSMVDTLSASDFEAFLDLNGLDFGRTSNVTITIDYDAEAYDQIVVEPPFPSTSDIEIDQEITKDVEVTIDLRGNTARTHTLDGDPYSDEETIPVTGPAALVNPIVEARATIFLDNARETRSESRRLTFYNRQGTVVGITSIDSTLENRTVLVTVPIQERAGIADLPVEVDLEGEAAENFRYLGATANPRSVLVSGPPEIINELRSIKTEPVDITGLIAPEALPVQLVLPEFVEFEETREFVVDVNIEPIVTSDFRNVPPEIFGLGENLTVTVRTNDVLVVLFGQLAALQSLADEDVVVSLNLVDLGEGTHSVIPDVSVPVQSIEVRSTDPSEITVEIQSTLVPSLTITGTDTISGTDILTTTEGYRSVPGETLAGLSGGTIGLSNRLVALLPWVGWGRFRPNFTRVA